MNCVDCGAGMGPTEKATQTPKGLVCESCAPNLGKALDRYAVVLNGKLIHLTHFYNAVAKAIENAHHANRDRLEVWGERERGAHLLTRILPDPKRPRLKYSWETHPVRTMPRRAVAGRV